MLVLAGELMRQAARLVAAELIAQADLKKALGSELRKRSGPTCRWRYTQKRNPRCANRGGREGNVGTWEVEIVGFGPEKPVIKKRPFNTEAEQHSSQGFAPSL